MRDSTYEQRLRRTRIAIAAVGSIAIGAGTQYSIGALVVIGVFIIVFMFVPEVDET